MAERSILRQKQKSIKGDLKYHEQEREGFQELRTLVQRWKKLPKAPTQERALKGKHIPHEAKRQT